MKIERKMAATALFVALSAVGVVASAQTVRIANQGDALSMDPHSLNETLQLSVTGNVYEPLVGRNKDLSLTPMLATSWKQTSPTVWRFELRKGVQFHDGTPFTADDVVFSLARTQVEGSDMKSYTNDFKEVRKIDSHTVEIETKTPFPILPDVLSLVYIMSKKWCETNQATVPVDRRKGVENTASFKANGTGPSVCASASPTSAPCSRATALTRARSKATCPRWCSPPSATMPPAWRPCFRAKWM